LFERHRFQHYRDRSQGVDKCRLSAHNVRTIANAHDGENRSRLPAPQRYFYKKRKVNVDGGGLLETLSTTLEKLPTMRKTNRLHLLTAAALAIGSLVAINARGAVGDIYETNMDQILRMNPVGGVTPGTFAGGLAGPKGLVFDGNGHLYVAEAGAGRILLFTTPDASSTVYAIGFSSPVGLAFDVAGEFLYVAEAGAGNIVKLGTDGTRTNFATGLGAPAGLTFANNGNLFVADFNGGKIYQITPAGTVTTFASGLNLPAGLAFDAAGNLFEADSGSGSILKFAPDGTHTTFASGLSDPYGVAFESSGNLIVSDHGNGGTFRYTPAGVQSVIFSSNFNTPQFVAIEPAIHQFLNISTRGFVQGGDHILIAGFIIGGTGPVGITVVVRAIGPSLPASVTDPLPDPVLEVRDSSGNLIAMNNDWQDAPVSQRVDTNLAPTNPHESALRLSLRGGRYTAIVYGGGDGATFGTAVVEAYKLP
jgi:sugar lactone lactonase YvrE